MSPTTERSPLYAADTMLFIYHFEAHPRFGQAAGRLLAAAEAGRCRLVVSVIALLEALVVPKRHGDEALSRRYRDLFEGFPNLSVVPVDAELAEAAAELRATRGLRTPDSIHVATAMRAGAEAFVTEDRRLRDLPGLPVRTFAQVT